MNMHKVKIFNKMYGTNIVFYKESKKNKNLLKKLVSNRKTFIFAIPKLE